MTLQDQELTRTIFRQVREDMTLIVLLGKDQYIDNRIKDLNDLAPKGKTKLKSETETKLRIIFHSSLN